MLFNAFFISNKFSINKFCNCCVSNVRISKKWNAILCCLDDRYIFWYGSL